MRYDQNFGNKLMKNNLGGKNQNKQINNITAFVRCRILSTIRTVLTL